MFRSHQVKSVKKCVYKSNADLAVIPGGLTSILQPLDVPLNKPFKDKMCNKWSTWMLDGEKTFTKGGLMKAPTLSTLCTWVKESWDAIDEKRVIKAFKKCGISNSLDGTEDDLLYQSSENNRSRVKNNVYDDVINSEDFRDLFSSLEIDAKDCVD